jgi:glycosyltransferase involved in cell wall biosynthesis
LNVLVVNWQDRLNPQGGGAETHLHETFGRLAGRGYRVVLLASGWRGAPARVQLDGIDVHRVGGRHSFTLRAAPYYRRRLARERFDVVVEDLNKIPLFTPYWVDRPLALLVHHLFGATAFREASAPIAAVTWAFEQPIGRVYRDVPTVAVSESTRDDLVSRGLSPERIEVVHNGVDLGFFTPDEAVARFAQPTFLYMGRLRRYKSIDLQLRAVARLRDEGLHVQLLIGGRGAYEPALREMTRRLGVEDRVGFLGFVSEEQKRALMRSAWANLLTSPKEGWGIANIEAAACATPTIASDAPGLRESVRHGETGLLVPHGDVGALADAMRRLATDGTEVHRLGNAAAVFARRFAWDAAATSMERFLERVAAPATLRA